MKPGYAVPTLFQVMIFRMGRTSMRLELDDTYIDYRYYTDQGWFESDYYYPTRLGMLKKGIGNLADSLSVAMTRAR